jgi:hypothetical protein
MAQGLISPSASTTVFNGVFCRDKLKSYCEDMFT